MTDHPARLRPDERNLEGRWVTSKDGVQADQVCHRIEFLTEQALEVIAVSADGWSRLYRDPGDQRLWELTYPASHMHGGGPPCLSLISESAATATYSPPWGRAEVERRRVGRQAELWRTGQMGFNDFMNSAPEAPGDSDIAELVDLIEHEPQRGGVFGVPPLEHDRHMARIDALIRLLLQREKAG